MALTNSSGLSLPEGGGGGGIDGSYDNTGTNLTSTTLQDAITELDSNDATLQSNIDTVASDLSALESAVNAYNHVESWAYINSTGAVLAGYNILSVNNSASGTYDITLLSPVATVANGRAVMPVPTTQGTNPPTVAIVANTGLSSVSQYRVVLRFLNVDTAVYTNTNGFFSVVSYAP